MIAVFARGAFGEAVARLLRERTPAVSRPLDADGALDGCDFAVAAFWRPYEEECRRLDAACRAAGIAWTSVVVRENQLFCGPTLHPAAGACYRCFERRHASHLHAPERDAALAELYARDEDAGPPGFLPAAAGMGAAAALEARAAGVDAAGLVRRVDLLRGVIVESRVVRVHGCGTCGRSDEAAPDRFVRHLVPALEEALPR